MRQLLPLLCLLPLLLTACGDEDDVETAAPNNASNTNNSDANNSDANNAATSPCDQAADFLDVTGSSAGAAYPDPELSAACEGDEVVVRSNGIPNFEFIPLTPNALTAQDFTFRFPRSPAPAAAPSDIPLLGAAAVAVNGLPIFGPTEAPNDGYQDPVLDDLLDFCNGHTAPGGVYHFHARPECLIEDNEGNTHLVLAYAFDGYPILAPWICDDAACTTSHRAVSSWQRIADQFDANGDPLYNNTAEGAWDIHAYIEGSGDLDQCNGRTLPDGSYAYYATDTFPYFIGCYTGTPTANNILGGGGMPPGGGPPPGGG